MCQTLRIIGIQRWLMKLQKIYYIYIIIALSSWTEENKENQEFIIWKAKVVKLVPRTAVLHSGWALESAVGLSKPQIPTYYIRLTKTGRDTLKWKLKFFMYIRKNDAEFKPLHKQKGYYFSVEENLCQCSLVQQESTWDRMPPLPASSSVLLSQICSQRTWQQLSQHSIFQFLLPSATLTGKRI